MRVVLSPRAKRELIRIVEWWKENTGDPLALLFSEMKEATRPGLMLHLGIWLTIAVGPFSYVSLAYYLAFLRPEEHGRLWQRLRSLVGPLPAAANDSVERFRTRNRTAKAPRPPRKS